MLGNDEGFLPSNVLSIIGLHCVMKRGLILNLTEHLLPHRLWAYKDWKDFFPSLCSLHMDDISSMYYQKVALTPNLPFVRVPVYDSTWSEAEPAIRHSKRDLALRFFKTTSSTE